MRLSICSSGLCLLAAFGCTGPEKGTKEKRQAAGHVLAPSGDESKPAAEPGPAKRNLRIVIHDSGTADPNEAVKLAASAVEKVERLTNPDIEDSDLARVNREAFAKDVEIAPETVTAIERALYWTQRSGGAFDLTAGPLVRLWRQAAEAGNLPDNGQIQQALSLKGCSEVRLGRSNRTVRLAREGMRLDLGGVAVGYAMDLAARALRSSGVRCAELRIEDDLCAFGRQSSGGKPTMVIEHPARRGKVLGAFEVTDAAVATVRCSQGAFKVGDKWYSGIINPQTGRPTEQVVSTTVMTTNGADAEALAHALFVLGPDAGKALIDKLPTTEALILSVDPANPGGFRTVVTQKLKALMKWQVEK